MNNKIKSPLYGLAIGDAVGRLYEFREPNQIPSYELIDIFPPEGFCPTYPNVLIGTWTDDTAQTLALLDSLNRFSELNLDYFAKRLVDWLNNGAYTPDGIFFDVGIQTLQALTNIKNGYLLEHTGNDTDTKAAIRGGLTGLKFGLEGMPDRWVQELKGQQLIDE